MPLEFVELFAALGVWSGVISTVFLYLHARRSKILQGFQKQLNEIRGEIRDVTTINQQEHAIQRTQINDIALTIARDYVRASQLDRTRLDINGLVTDIRKDIGALNNRIDNLLRPIERRHGQ